MLEANQKGGGTLGECLRDQSFGALFAVSLGGRILTWDRDAEAVFGHLASEAMGSRLVVPFARRTEAKQQLQSAVEDGCARLEVLRRRKDGQKVYVADPIARARLPLNGGVARRHRGRAKSSCRSEETGAPHAG